jgi:hypothetical protein
MGTCSRWSGLIWWSVLLLFLPVAVFAAQQAASALDDAVAAATSGSSTPPIGIAPPSGGPGPTAVHPINQPPAVRDVRTLSENERRRMMMYLFMRGATGRNTGTMMR